MGIVRRFEGGVCGCSERFEEDGDRLGKGCDLEEGNSGERVRKECACMF